MSEFVSRVWLATEAIVICFPLTALFVVGVLPAQIHQLIDFPKQEMLEELASGRSGTHPSVNSNVLQLEAPLSPSAAARLARHDSLFTLGSLLSAPWCNVAYRASVLASVVRSAIWVLNGSKSQDEQRS